MTDEELIELIELVRELVRKNYVEVNHDYLIQPVQSACQYCLNNPINGGSGICHCILGQPVIY